MKKVLIILSLLLSCQWIAAQDPGLADQLFSQGDYENALTMYRQLYHRYPGMALYSYRLGRCEQELGMYEDAIKHLEESGDRYALQPLWLARAAFSLYRFEYAQTKYNEWISHANPDEHRYAGAVEELACTENILRFFNRVENIAYVDTISFSRDSFEQKIPKLSPDMGTITMQDGCFISTNERGDRRFLSFVDSQTGRKLIGRQEWLLHGWSAIDTLPVSVNHCQEQDFPILMPDGVTLYYSARDTAGGLGGWDIYMTKYNPVTNTYLNSELLGMPFNSLSDDLLYLYDETAGMGYLVTNRIDGQRCTLCRFIAREPRYLRDSTENYLSDYVRLLRLPKAKAEVQNEPTTSPILAELEPAKPAFTLVINDSTTYTQLSDFKRTEARDAMQRYLDVIEQIESERQELNLRRDRFGKTDSIEDKASLTATILALEQDIRRLMAIADNLRKEVLQKEVIRQ